ncbi:similar to vp80 protein [Rhodopirellula baltica SH 1]|uniref:Similar to vp80 protein n=1 Tax=Rhodopirellula baltica (strain DSM 10527 / NCIMB 13988 / SH1) TaxID=243090 RepID=Q7UL07_RHOBA|nr:similar to vp80 protein [Rhodopirellula baltica SH 1]
MSGQSDVATHRKCVTRTRGIEPLCKRRRCLGVRVDHRSGRHLANGRVAATVGPLHSPSRSALEDQEQRRRRSDRNKALVGRTLRAKQQSSNALAVLVFATVPAYTLGGQRKGEGIFLGCLDLAIDGQVRAVDCVFWGANGSSLRLRGISRLTISRVSDFRI